jgi:short-subunit dehydrogenase
MRRTLRGCRAIITGTSSGIGRELALALAAKQAKLIVNARRVERLSALVAEINAHGGEARIVAGDIAEPSTREHLVAMANEKFGGLDLLINNAGIGAMGPFAQANSERLRRIMEVNFFAPLELIRIALPYLVVGNHPVDSGSSRGPGQKRILRKQIRSARFQRRTSCRVGSIEGRRAACQSKYDAKRVL